MVASHKSQIRVTQNQCLVVPPFECAWLSGQDFILSEHGGCLQFEAKAENDVTIMLRSTPGVKRIVDHSAVPSSSSSSTPSTSTTPPSSRHEYIIVLGSHRNSRLKIERNGRDQVVLPHVPGSRVSFSGGFSLFYVQFVKGAISVGLGMAGDPASPSYTWVDDEPMEDIRFIGLSTWDKHIVYRNIKVTLPVPLGSSSTALPIPLPLSMPPSPTTPLMSSSRVPTLTSMCAALLASSLRPDTVCLVTHLAELLLPDTDALFRQCITTLARQLRQVLLVDEALFSTLMSDEVVARVLRHEALGMGEMEVYSAVALWATRRGDNEHDEGEEGEGGGLRSMRELERVLPLVRFPLLTNQELVGIASSNFYAQSSLLRDLVQEAFDVHAAAETEVDRMDGLSLPSPPSSSSPPNAARIDSTPPTTPHNPPPDQQQPPPNLPLPPPLSPPLLPCRRPPAAAFLVEDGRLVHPASGDVAAACLRLQRRLAADPAIELMHIVDGDQNGVLHYLGTHYHSEPWRNPVSEGIVRVLASSPPSRYTDARSIVSNKFLSTSYTLPSFVKNSGDEDEDKVGGVRVPSSWWMFDLGSGHRLACTHYCIRHDGSTDYIRNWVLQGSNSVNELGIGQWTELKRHVDDASIRLPGQYASWAVARRGGGAPLPFRYLRLKLTGGGANAENPFVFPLSHAEFYGFFYQARGEDK